MNLERMTSTKNVIMFSNGEEEYNKGISESLLQQEER